MLSPTEFSKVRVVHLSEHFFLDFYTLQIKTPF